MKFTIAVTCLLAMSAAADPFDGLEQSMVESTLIEDE